MSTSRCSMSQFNVERIRPNTLGASAAEPSENAWPPERRAIPVSSPPPTWPNPTAKIGIPAASIG
jgi:hypothetical protein